MGNANSCSSCMEVLKPTTNGSGRNRRSFSAAAGRQKGALLPPLAKFMRKILWFLSGSFLLGFGCFTPPDVVKATSPKNRAALPLNRAQLQISTELGVGLQILAVCVVHLNNGKDFPQILSIICTALQCSYNPCKQMSSMHFTLPAS